MFKINIPTNAKLNDVNTYADAKADLHMQHLRKVAAAPRKDTYAFGQKVAESRYNVTRAFKDVLRQLNETCMANCEGQTIAKESEMQEE